MHKYYRRNNQNEKELAKTKQLLTKNYTKNLVGKYYLNFTRTVTLPPKSTDFLYLYMSVKLLKTIFK